MSGRPPDVCEHVFTCGFGDWQVQVAPRVRSDLGGAIDTFRAIAEAHRDHIFAEHTDAQREAMRATLERGGGPVVDLRQRQDGTTTAFLLAVPLPKWWVNK